MFFIKIRTDKGFFTLSYDTLEETLTTLWSFNNIKDYQDCLDEDIWDFYWYKGSNM